MTQTSISSTRATDASGMVKNVLTLTTSFPSKVQPVHGVFVKERVRFVSQLPNVNLRVASPIPYFPPWKLFKRWYPWSQVPLQETIDGLSVVRRRYFLPPKLGGYFHPRLARQAAERIIRAMQPEFDFDIVDTHFIYPSGVLGTWIARKYDKPLVITCRGEDIERFPSLPIVGRQIRTALQKATQMIAVSERIKETMVRLGADDRRVTVITNGVDCEKFRPVERSRARSNLGIPADRPMVLAVGYRLELKGFHLLIDAINKVRETHPGVLVCIVGGQARWAADFLPEIERRILDNSVEQHVLLAGARPQTELADWYSAADLLAILSSREGSPNVLMEAMACGLPAIATRVGGIPDVLNDESLGMLLANRSAKAAADGIVRALDSNWDRGYIRHAALKRSWQDTARKVDAVFDRALAESP